MPRASKPGAFALSQPDHGQQSVRLGTQIGGACIEDGGMGAKSAGARAETTTGSRLFNHLPEQT
jgi:hypothetical protein